MRVAGLRAFASALWGILFLISVQAAGPALAQSASASSAPPPQVDELLRLLEDPAIRQWIDQQKQSRKEPEGEVAPDKTSEMMETRVMAVRTRLAGLAAELPRLPNEIRNAADLLSMEIQNRPFYDVLILIVGFLFLGAGLEWIFGRATASIRERMNSRPIETIRERLSVVGMRLVFGLVKVAIFAAGSIGAFLVFEWPPLLRRIVLAYLLAAVLLRLVLLFGRILLAPEAADSRIPGHFRIVPVSNQAALFWHRRIALFAGWFAFGWATVASIHTLGFSLDGRRLIAYLLGIGLLMIGLEAVWRRPVDPMTLEADRHPVRHRALVTWLLSLYLVLLWVFWVAGLMGLFWLLVVAGLLPKAVSITRMSVQNLLRPAGGAEVVGAEGANHAVEAVYLDRGVRALMIVGAALFLAWVWNIDLVELTSRDTVVTRLVRGGLSSIVILLVADLIWQVVKAQIDRRLVRIQAAAPPGSDEALRQARLRTLLPIFRMVVFIVLATVAVLMALSSLGVEIGPLIAGAGIAGVAVGFGSQTLVKDIISGVFYLLDDAFRVGEYIQSGSYKGTVESLGFRSVKLRHHRGPIYTVPYGLLGAVENMSRDWVIDKMTINVTYDTDLDKAKKIIKQVGKDLAADPELAANIIEPLKMQGVEQFGDFAIQLRMKMMTRPGEQFVIRRRAYALLKKAFDENGIRFAFPTVQVSGTGDVEPAAAQHALKLIKGTPTE